MSDPERYRSAAGVEAAIRDAARKAHAADPSLSITDRIRQEYFRRFLSRIFSEEHDSDWLLKGGTGMLARVASARTTTDIDLFRANRPLHAALDDLKRLAAVELDDHFRFEYLQHRDAIAGEQQTNTMGYAVTFDVYIGASRKEPLHVDLVVLATAEDVNADDLHRAIESERCVRALEPFTAFSIPPAWGAKYAKLARSVPLCTDFPSVEAAAALIRDFIDPVFAGSARGQTWRHAERHWSD